MVIGRLVKDVSEELAEDGSSVPLQKCQTICKSLHVEFHAAHLQTKFC